MQEVSKDEFRAIYFRYARDVDGWTTDYWDHFYAADREPPMRYCVELPQTPAHCRMMIVDDFAAREVRLFFLTEESEESFFGGLGDD